MKKILHALLLTSALQSTAQTPQLVHDINTGTPESNPTNLCVFNNKLYFEALVQGSGKELYAYDGISNPVLVSDINPGAQSSMFGSLRGFTVLGNKLYFAANNGINGYELMAYDGVTAPVVVSDIVAGSTGSFPVLGTVINDKLFFKANNGVNGDELFVYDGTGTPTMHELNPGLANGAVAGFCEFNGKLYFPGNDGVNGEELFSFDPATAVINLVTDINTGVASSFPSLGFTYNNILYFIAGDVDYGRELYSYDGSIVTRLTDINSGPQNSVIGSSMVVYNNCIFFSGADVGSFPKLFKYDIATGIASLVADIYPNGPLLIGNFIVYGNKLYFSANDDVNGEEMRIYDGTALSVLDLFPGQFSGGFLSPAIFNGKLYFNGRASQAIGAELYVLDDPSVSSVKKVQFNCSVVVVPNPANGNATLQLTLQQTAILNLKITDITGRVIWKKESQQYISGNTSIIIPLSEYPVGTYFYNLTDANGTTVNSGKVVRY